jgi:hypothetical protein
MYKKDLKYLDERMIVHLLISHCKSVNVSETSSVLVEDVNVNADYMV